MYSSFNAAHMGTRLVVIKTTQGRLRMRGMEKKEETERESALKNPNVHIYTVY